MGQDISMAIERWSDGRWNLVNDIIVWQDRNYDMFAILDGRRGGRIPCVASSRGYPIDAHPDTRIATEDTHSHSWLLLSEIKVFNWNTTWSRDGLIPLRKIDNIKEDLESFEEWVSKPDHEPYRYLTSFDKSNHLFFTQAIEYLKEWNPDKIAKFGWDLSLPFYVRVSWSIRCQEVAGTFLEWIDEEVSPLGEGNAIRLVFGFDS